MAVVASAHGVSKRFGPTEALAAVHLAVQAGEVHGLVGRNGAGKSTLVSVLTGLTKPESGRVRFGSEAAPPLADREAWRGRVACVYQKSMIIPELTVTENLFLNRQADRRVISWGRLRQRASKILDGYGVPVKPSLLAKELTVEQRQLVEIARVLSTGVRFVVLDEPTAQLDGPAIDRLFASMRALQATGVTFLFVSHRLQEVYDICQSVTVLRDGRGVLSTPVQGLSHRDLLYALTGEGQPGPLAIEAGPAEPPPPPPEKPKPRPRKKKEPVVEEAPAPPREIVLDVAGLSLVDRFTGIDLDAGVGEIVGVTGSASSGKVALAECLVGVRAADSGTVTVDGVCPRPGRPEDALAAGIGFVPQDGYRAGLMPLLSIAENVTLPIAGQLGRRGLIEPARLREAGRKAIADFDIQATGPKQPVFKLSAGNAQKVVLARALSTQPKALVLINPTAGVDIRSKDSLWNRVMVAASNGTAVVLVSDDLDDLRICDRVLVLFHGRVVLEARRGWAEADVVSAIEGVEGVTP